MWLLLGVLAAMRSTFLLFTHFIANEFQRSRGNSFQLRVKPICTFLHIMLIQIASVADIFKQMFWQRVDCQMLTHSP